MPLLGMLGVLFIGLKLTGHIDWSWWYVTMPLWIGVAIFGGIALISGLVVIHTIIARSK